MPQVQSHPRIAQSRIAQPQGWRVPPAEPATVRLAQDDDDAAVKRWPPAASIAFIGLTSALLWLMLSALVNFLIA